MATKASAPARGLRLPLLLLLAAALALLLPCSSAEECGDDLCTAPPAPSAAAAHDAEAYEAEAHDAEAHEAEAHEAHAREAPLRPLVFHEGFDAGWQGRWLQAEGSGWRQGGPAVDPHLEAGAGAGHAAVRWLEALLEPRNEDTCLQFDLRAGGGAWSFSLRLVRASGADYSRYSAATPSVLALTAAMRDGAATLALELHHWVPAERAYVRAAAAPVEVALRPGRAHLYGACVTADNGLELYFDGALVFAGSLLEDLEPPVNRPETVAATPPEGYEPERWDEEQPGWELEPELVPDEDARRPDDWREDCPALVAHPEARQPEEWREEEDGVWEAPLVPNEWGLHCAAWRRPLVPNPRFRGRRLHLPARVRNPLANRNLHPHNLASSAGVGAVLEGSAPGLAVDNLVVARTRAGLEAVASGTVPVKRMLERGKHDQVRRDAPPQLGSSAQALAATVSPYTSAAAAVMAAAVVGGLVLFCCSSGTAPAAPVGRQDGGANGRKKQKKTKKKTK